MPSMCSWCWSQHSTPAKIDIWETTFYLESSDLQASSFQRAELLHSKVEASKTRN